MADNKQYVTLPQENGAVLISEDVVATIVSQTVKDIEGVYGICARYSTDIVELINRKNWRRGLRVTIAQNDQITIDCDLIICYGQSVVDVAKAAQSAVVAAVASVTGVNAITVNVNICGIVRK